jgi:glutathione synthase/RimK-type ligase-like ATP-grasp enzyme
MIIGLATSTKVPELSDDDRLLVDALAAAGVRAEPAIWNDAAHDWRRYSAVVIRSTWDYHLMPDQFLAWLAMLEAIGVQVFNAPELVRWNSEKRYLRDLAARGIATVPTRWVERGEKTSLAQIIGETGWSEVVVKPSVSASAHQTWRMSLDDANAGETQFKSMVANGRVLVQPFLAAIQDEGEWSLLFYDGVYSHAVLKRPGENDFRVQREHGGSADARVPSAHVIGEAHRVLEAVDIPPLYARVDGCVVDGEFVLMELEMIEPDLFLRAHPEAPSRLAKALLMRCR